MINPTLLLVDGNSVLHRVLFTELGSLSVGNIGTGGVLGFLKYINSILNVYPTVSRVVVVWDGGKSERRKAMYPEYKGGRNKDGAMDDHYAKFSSQSGLIRGNLATFGMREIFRQGREADDIIGWVARRVETPKVISTEDRDFLQLVGPNTVVYFHASKGEINQDNFLEVMGTPPNLFLLRKAILGDKSDNISGITGVGSVTVDRLIFSLASDDNIGGLPGKIPITEHCEKLRVKDSRNRWKYSAIANNMETVRRNLFLMDLRQEVFTPEDELIMETAVSAGRMCMNEEAAIAFLGHLRLGSLLESWQWFRGPFARLQ